MSETQTKTLGAQLRENVARQRETERVAKLELEARMLRDRINGFERCLEELKVRIRTAIQEGAHAPEMRFDENTRMSQELSCLTTVHFPDGKVLFSATEPTMPVWRAFRHWIDAEELALELRYDNHGAYEGEQSHEYVFQLILPEDAEAVIAAN
jgi:hypothetical protein